LLIGSVAIACIGIYNLVSAGRNSSVWSAQAVYLAVGIVVLIAVTLIDYRLVQRAAVPIYLLNIILLLALKVVGTKAKGAESWLVLGPLRVAAGRVHEDRHDPHDGESTSTTTSGRPCRATVFCG